MNKNVTALNNYLHGLAVRRANNTVSADDAARWLDRKGIEDATDRRRIVNSVLHTTSTTFTPSGFTNSERSSMRGSRIREWTHKR